MKLSTKAFPLIRHSEAAELLTSRAVLLACEEAGWLKACVKRKKMTVYNRADVLAAAQRILSGEYPKVQGCKSQNTTAKLGRNCPELESLTVRVTEVSNDE